MLLAGLHGGRRFAEKNPENSFVVPFLAEAMPDAQFIHIIRDGRDAAVSHSEQPWLNAKSAGSGKRGRGGQLWGPAARWWVEPGRREDFAAVSDIVRSAWCWRRFTEAALDGLATLPAGKSIEVRYESVVSDPMRAADLLSGFLGTTPAGLDALRLAGCRTAYVDGSFVTAKESPGDFDVCWDARGVRASLLDPVLLIFYQGRALQKAKYGGEFFPAHFPADVSGITYLEFFQQDKHTNATKGIVALDLGGLP